MVKIICESKTFRIYYVLQDLIEVRLSLEQLKSYLRHLLCKAGWSLKQCDKICRFCH